MLDVLRGLLGQATPGPLVKTVRGSIAGRRVMVTAVRSVADGGGFDIGEAYDSDDAALIVAAVNVLPVLVEIAEAARSVREITKAETVEMDDLHAAIDRLDVALARLEREETQ